MILQLLICQNARATSSLMCGNSPLLNLQYTVWNLDRCTRPDSSKFSLSCQICLLQLPSSVQPRPTRLTQMWVEEKKAKSSTQRSGCCWEQTWWEFWECRRFTLLLGCILTSFMHMVDKQKVKLSNVWFSYTQTLKTTKMKQVAKSHLVTISHLPTDPLINHRVKNRDVTEV